MTFDKTRGNPTQDELDCLMEQQTNPVHFPGEDKIRCPYCGIAQTDLWEYLYDVPHGKRTGFVDIECNTCPVHMRLYWTERHVKGAIENRDWELMQVSTQEIPPYKKEKGKTK